MFIKLRAALCTGDALMALSRQRRAAGGRRSSQQSLTDPLSPCKALQLVGLDAATAAEFGSYVQESARLCLQCSA